jgi:hypothetical protein
MVQLTKVIQCLSSGGKFAEQKDYIPLNSLIEHYQHRHINFIDEQTTPIKLLPKYQMYPKEK